MIALLAVADQDGVALFADLGAVLLQAGEHRQVAIVHHGATMARNVWSAGFLLVDGAAALRILSECARGRGHENGGDKQ
jgi:hypothetical protein